MENKIDNNVITETKVAKVGRPFLLASILNGLMAIVVTFSFVSFYILNATNINTNTVPNNMAMSFIKDILPDNFVAFIELARNAIVTFQQYYTLFLLIMVIGAIIIFVVSFFTMSVLNAKIYKKNGDANYKLFSVFTFSFIIILFSSKLIGGDFITNNFLNYLFIIKFVYLLAILTAIFNAYISGKQFYRNISNKHLSIDEATTHVFKILAILIIIIFSIKIIGQTVSYWTLLYFVGQIDLTNAISISNILNLDNSGSAINNILSPFLNIFGSIFNIKTPSVNNFNNLIDTTFNQYVMTYVDSLVKSMIINIMKPLILKNMFAYITGFIIGVFSFYSTTMNTKYITTEARVILKAVLSTLLFIIFATYVSEFYSLIINIILILIILGFIVVILQNVKVIEKLNNYFSKHRLGE